MADFLDSLDDRPVWDGRKAARLSVSNWQTGDAEIDLALERFAAAAAQEPAHAPAR